jgi:hypothetical protein
VEAGNLVEADIAPKMLTARQKARESLAADRHQRDGRDALRAWRAVPDLAQRSCGGLEHRRCVPFDRILSLPLLARRHRRWRDHGRCARSRR